MTGLRVWTSGRAQGALERFALQMRPAIYRSMLQGAFALGRKVAEKIEDFKETPATKRLSRSFLVPTAAGDTFVLGMNSPVYAAIHEYGGVIKPKEKDYLVFRTPDGEWHSVREVTIREKRYGRDALDEFQAEHVMETLLAANLTASFKGLNAS